MMMALGLFVFELRTAPYQRHEHNQEWRHPSVSRVGLRPATQYVGPGEDSRTLSGTLYPELTGGRVSLMALELMASTGKAWPLIAGTGIPAGMYVITSLRKTDEVFFKNGEPRKIEFELQLKRIGQDPLDLLPDLIGKFTSEMLGWLS